MYNLRGFHSLRERYEADFHNPGIYGSGRVWIKRWTCFVTRRDGVAAVAELLWTYW